LKKHGKDYQAIVEGRQGHGFRDQDASVSFYAVLETFLATHLMKTGVKVGPPRTIEMPAKR
jgi:hypothetical protein